MSSLFGSLFGALPVASNVAIDAQPITLEFVELAVELIDEFIEEPNAIWLSIQNDSLISNDRPWEVQRGSSIEHAVKIVFLQDDLEDRQLIKYLKGTETTNGQVNGIMYDYGFTPSLKDVVKWQGRELVVNAIDPLAPIDKAIIYILEFGS